MATKKRISDLLQQEAQKGTPSEGEITIDTSATPVLSSEESDSPSVEETGATLLTSTDEEKIPAVEHTTPKRTNSNKAELEATVELREKLKQSNQKETEFQQQIDDLKSDFSKQKSLAEKLSQELVEAKKVALQLAESNTQLTEEINALKQENKTPQPINYKKSYPTIEKPPEKPTPQSINYKKSYHTVVKLPEKQPEEDANASAQMWLLD